MMFAWDTCNIDNVRRSMAMEVSGCQWLSSTSQPRIRRFDFSFGTSGLLGRLTAPFGLGLTFGNSQHINLNLLFLVY